MSRCLLSLNPCNPWTRWLSCWCEQWFSIVLVLFCCSVVSFRARACRVPVCLSCVCVSAEGVSWATKSNLLSEPASRGWMFYQSSKTQNPLPPRIKDPLTAGEEREEGGCLTRILLNLTSRPFTRAHTPVALNSLNYACLFFLSLYGRGNIFFTAREEAGRVRVLTPSFRANKFVLFPPLLQSACTTRSCFVQRSGWVLVHFEEQKKKNRSLRTLWEWWGMGGAGRDSEMKQQPSYPTLFRPG